MKRGGSALAKDAKPTRWERFLEQKTAPQRFLLALASIVTALGVVIGGIFALATTFGSAPAAPGQSHEVLPSCSTGSGDWTTVQGQTDWIGGWVEGKDQSKSFFDAALTVAVRDIDPASSSADFVMTADSSKCESKDVKPGDSWSLEEGRRRYRVKFLSINTLGDAVELQLKCRTDDGAGIEGCTPGATVSQPLAGAETPSFRWKLPRS
jgi:hypothetical protein